MQRNPTVDVTPPTTGETGRPLSETERINYIVEKQEELRQAQGFRPSDSRPQPQIGFTVYQHPTNLNYDKDLVTDRVGISGRGSRNASQKFWQVGEDHLRLYDRVYYDRRNTKFRRHDFAWDTELADPEYEPPELDDMNQFLRRKNRDVVKYVFHIRNVGKAIQSNLALATKIASKSLSTRTTKWCA